MVQDCIFCKIISGQIPADFVYRDDRVVAIRDVNPQAPTHVLLMPRQHISSMADLRTADAELMGHLILVAHQVAGKEGLADRGYRLAVNYGQEGGQFVPHIHFHLVGGRQLSNSLG
jgi:histidine triad (HIT) family protein